MRTIHTEEYHTSMEHLLHRFDAEAGKLGFKAENIPEYQAWSTKVRDKLAEITGISRMEKCELKPELLESIQMDGYRRNKMLIQTEPDVWMPFYVLIPDDVEQDGKRASMIAPHGHLGGGKYAVAGRKDIPAVKDLIVEYNYDYGVRFVREGFITFCPDARAFGERREWMKQTDAEEDFLRSTCDELNHMAICLGQSLTGMWTWDLMRLIDYIQTRDDCDAERIGCGGLSGGGLQTLWLAAMDDRIKCAVVSGYFYGYKDSILEFPCCGCNYVPHLWEYVDMGDLGALIAPRALLVETGNIDHLNGKRGLVNVTEQAEVTRKAYQVLDREDRFSHNVYDGGHKWYGEKTYPFLKKWLMK